MIYGIYKNLFANNHLVMLIIQPDTGRIIDANKAACQYYGLKKHELTTMHIQEINTLPQEAVLKEMENARHERRNYFNFSHRLEAYIKEHSDAEFSHGICPECVKKLYPHLKLNPNQS